MDSAFECAASKGSAATLTMVLDHDNKPGTWMFEERYQNTMYKALEGGHAEVVRILLSRRRQTCIHISIHGGMPSILSRSKAWTCEPT